jgi:hypothetical protein
MRETSRYVWIKEKKGDYELIVYNPFHNNKQLDNPKPFMYERYYENQNHEKIPEMDLLFPVRVKN